MMAILHRARGLSVNRHSAMFLMAALGSGILIGLTVAIAQPMDSRGSIALGFAALGSFVAMRTRWLMSAAVFLMLVNPSLLPALAEFQGFTIRIIDAVAILLAAHVVLGILVRAKRPVLTVSGGRIFGLTAAFLVYVGLTLLTPLYQSPEHFPVAAISYVRLVSSFALAVTIYPLLDRMENFALIKKVIVTAAFTNGLVAMFQWIQSGIGSPIHPTLRLSGLLGPVGLGLAGGLLLILSPPEQGQPVARSRRWAGRIGVLMGLLMLLVSKSASAIVAAGVGASLLLLLVRRSRVTKKQLIVAALILTVGLAAVVGLRWFDVVGLFEVSGGSFTQRLIVGYAAWLIFLDHPLWGVGWQTSWSPAVIGDPIVSEQVRQRLGELPQVLLPEENPTSVHNFYLQVLAELGIVGVIIFASIVIQLIRACQGLLRRLSPKARAVVVQWTVILVMLGTWLNTNPLFGGQMPAYLFFLAIAVITAAPRLALSDSLPAEPSKPGAVLSS